MQSKLCVDNLPRTENQNDFIIQISYVSMTLYFVFDVNGK